MCKMCKYYDLTMESNCSKGENGEGHEECQIKKGGDKIMLTKIMELEIKVVEKLNMEEEIDTLLTSFKQILEDDNENDIDT